MNDNLTYKNRNRLGLSGIIGGSLLTVIFLAGCAHIISRETLKEVDRGITFEQLVKDPMKYNGKTVLLGGVIVKTENRKDGTLLELYQTDLDGYGQPVNPDDSEGRFLAMDKRFLDGEIYREGRRVTLAGVVSGIQVVKLGEIDYSCPYIDIKEIYLWKEQRIEYGPRYRGYRDPYWMWGYPWHPWYYPYWPYKWYYRSYDDNNETSKKSRPDTGRVIDESLK
jgi:outer membrane lipoprotein